MGKYRLEGGGTITDADIDRICDEFESESWTERLERIHHGPAALPDEPLVTVAVKFPQSMVTAIDSAREDRSDFIRRAVAAAL